MTLHCFGNFITPHGVASNNRGQNEGNLATLQKIVWNADVHSTVSAEALRFAVRTGLADAGHATNRVWDAEARVNTWTDANFTNWRDFIDDDVLGFMRADAAKSEVDSDDAKSGAPEETGAKAPKSKAKGPKAKGTTTARRSAIEFSRAVSLTPWSGDCTFHAASPGASPAAAKKGDNPVPYSTEVHATRYQYGFSFTPSSLHDVGRAEAVIRALISLGPVAGNHARFLFDFSPESVVFRLTKEAAPRILYTFSQTPDGRVSLSDLVRKVEAGDIKASELIIGGAVVALLTESDRRVLADATLVPGVVAAAEQTCRLLMGAL